VLPGGFTIRDLELDTAGRVWALAYGPYDREAKRGVVQLRRDEDGAFVEGLRLEPERYPRCIALSDQHVYLGSNMGGLTRVPVSALR